MAPSTPRSHGLKQKAISESCGLSVNFSFSGQVVFQKILEIFSYINTCKTVSHIMAPPDPWGPWSLQTWFCTMLLSLHVIFSFSGTVVLLQKIFEICFYIELCKHSFPYCGPTRPPGAMILTNFNLRYVWKLQNKLQLSWSCGYLEEDF